MHVSAPMSHVSVVRRLIEWMRALCPLSDRDMLGDIRTTCGTTLNTIKKHTPYHCN